MSTGEERERAETATFAGKIARAAFEEGVEKGQGELERVLWHVGEAVKTLASSGPPGMALATLRAALELEPLPAKPIDRAKETALEALGTARLAANWVVNHAGRNNAHDMEHARLALRGILEAQGVLRRGR